MIKPMLLSQQEAPFDSEDYLFELKLDGIRCIAHLSPDAVDLRNKENFCLTPLFPELKTIHKQTKSPCILDGELVLMENGVPGFEKLQRRAMMTDPFKIQLAANALPVSYVAFDILYQDGRELYSLPLVERKRLLAQSVIENEGLAVSRTIDGAGTALFEQAKALNLEGIVAKRKDSLYKPGKRTKDWIKIKNMIDEDFYACGFIQKERMTSLILGSKVNGQLTYQGHVTLGVPGREVREMATNPHCPFAELPPGNDDAVWFDYMPLCTVAYMERTLKGSMRQPVFKGFRLQALS